MSDVIQDPTLSARAVRYCRWAALPGAGLASGSNGEPLRAGVAGRRARSAAAPVHIADRWHIGSITKSMTALLLARQVALRTCTLDTPLAGVVSLPLHPLLAQRPVRDLLNHRAGLPANPERAQCLAGADTDYSAPEGTTRDAVLAPIVAAPPGRDRFRYSNLGYMLLGHIVEVLGGETWKTQVRRHIAEPLGLTSLGFGPPRDGQPLGHRGLASVLLTRHWQLGRPVPAHDPSAELAPCFAPAGLVHLNLADLTRYGMAIAWMLSGHDGLLPHPVFADLLQGKDYAGGWILAADAIGHTGSNGLWYAELRIRRSDGVATVFVTNTGAVRAAAVSAWAVRATARPAQAV